MAFRDRAEAGEILAERLAHFRNRDDVVVLALPRGGVPVAFEVARSLHAPLDVFLVRKLGVPGHEELAMGAIASGGLMVLNRKVIDSLHISDRLVQAVADWERRELQRREREYRGDRPPVEVAGRVAILVDDGLATGASMRAAAEALRQQHPARIVVAVPVAAPAMCEDLGRHVDEAICAVTPEPFYAVGMWYEDFSQTSEEEVNRLLTEARHWARQPAPLR
jgi:predicted phosphoribosyltransferase